MAREVEMAEYIGFAERIIRRAGERAANGDDWDLGELAGLIDHVEAALATAVAGIRAQGHSWAYVGDGLGITRQAAQQRYGRDARQPTETQ